MRGLTFKGIHSSVFNLIMLSDNRQVLSDVTRQTKQIPGYGTVDFGNDTYNEKTLSVILTYVAASLEALQTQAEQIGGWLYNDGKYYDLIFDDAPQRKYKAKVTGKINLSQSTLIGKISVEFTCNPPYPYALDNSPVSPADVQSRLLWDTATLVGTQYLQDLSANGIMKFTAGGAHSVKPVIKIIGNIASGLTLTYGSQMWKYNAALLFDGIIIDCVAQTVTRMSDGANLFPSVDVVKDDYFNLAIGQQSIAVSGVVDVWPNDLTVIIEFTPIP
jgi:predicted phage tail component-like protein